MGDFLYVCGGFDGIASLDTVERFDPDENAWSMVASMNKHRSAAGKWDKPRSENGGLVKRCCVASMNKHRSAAGKWNKPKSDNGGNWNGA